MKTFKNVDDYILSFPKETQLLLEQIRATIQKAAPRAEEYIGYAMPAYKLHGALVYFGGYKNHIGFYPSGSGIEAFKDSFGAYKFSKGAVQFPLDKKIPLALITKIVKYRAKENTEKEKLKAAKKK
ncbi:hypothetical protein CNR22_16510 [Sphingobacteriaceae bacterium]|nr:hypothetical protein CNR22_16510 [Sphingobacteriaceae bacterium]